MLPSAPTSSETSKKASKRDHILACARQVFATQGVERATMQDIARIAGVSKGALYLFFESKDELYYQLVSTVVDELFARMAHAAEGPGTGFERAKALLHTYARYYAEDVTRFRIALGWLAPGFKLNDSLPKALEYRHHIVEIMRMAVCAVEAGQRDGSIRPDLDARRTVLKCWGGSLGLLFLRSKAADEGPLPPPVDEASWNGVSPRVADVTTINLMELVDEYIDLVMTPLQP